MWFVESSRIVFAAGRPGGPGDLYTVFRSGKGMVNLTRTPGAYEATPSWSTGGGRITYARGSWGKGPGHSDIWVMTWTGARPQNLTHDAGPAISNTNPVWSPQQILLAYVRWTRGSPGIRLMSPGGLRIRNAVNLALLPGRDPAWSAHPDGGSFLLAYSNLGNLWEVHVPRVLPRLTGSLGVSPVRLTTHPAGRADRNPVFSPDGTKILFQRGGHAMVMDARPGSRPHLATSRPATDPDWEPFCTRQAGARGGTLVGTPGDDLLCGGRGNDTISGNGGSDVILAGGGTDTVYGGYGDDFIMGGVGASSDAIHGGPGNDYIDGGQGNDWLHGDGGNDRIVGGDGNDHLVGGPGNDSLVGGPGRDSIIPGSG
jgi:Ca2+-binding RTX toxin-like protein